MTRGVIPLVLLIAAAVGCGKKDDGGTGGGSGGDPEATHVVKFREKQDGDRFEVTETYVYTTEQESKTGSKEKANKNKDTGRFEFTEEVEKMDKGKTRPINVKRQYKVAETTPPAGKQGPASFQGKTLYIAATKTSGYTFRTDKGGIPAAETRVLHEDFPAGGPFRMSEIQPTRPVKVGDTWDIDRAKLSRMLGHNPDLGTFGGNGRLGKAYTKNGKQFGVVEWTVTLAVTPSPQTNQSGTSLSATLVYDGCIDGSSTEGESKLARSVTLTGLLGKSETRAVIEFNRTTTVKHLK